MESLSWLSELEREQLRQISNVKTQQRFVKTRHLLRSLLANFSDLNPAEIRLNKNKEGKWELISEAASPLYFNLSHTDDLSAVMVASEPIGVDLEKVSETAMSVEVVFTQAEKRWLSTQPELAKLRLWTFKEAFTKLTGMGPELDPLRFEIDGENQKLIHCDLSQWDAAKLSSVDLWVGGQHYYLSWAKLPRKP